jgi:hypothetical protein
MRATGSFGISLLLLTLAGCIPFPHYERVASELSGSVSDNGQPVVGVRVKRVLNNNLAHSMKCSSPGDETVTDRAGHFGFPSESRFRAVITLYRDSINLCAERTGQWLSLWHRSFLGETPPARIEIACDIGQGARPGQMCRCATPAR